MTNLGNVLDTYADIRIESPEPIASFDTSQVRLFVKDTSFIKLPRK